MNTVPDPRLLRIASGRTDLIAEVLDFTGAGHWQLCEFLIERGADPNACTTPGATTGSFMRDCRTRGEGPLHRAAAVGTPATIHPEYRSLRENLLGSPTRPA